MTDFPKLKLIRGHKAYTYYGNRTAEAMQFFLDPPQYLGWEVCPPEGIPGELDFAERLRRKWEYNYYVIIHSPVLKAICNLGIFGGLLLGCHSCCQICVACACRRRGRDERSEEDKTK
eukprot:UN1603